MVNPSFDVRASEMLESLLASLETQPECEDLDMDIVDGVLTVEFEDGSKLIINRQAPLQQLWVASPLGPAHFGYDVAQAAWLDDKTGEELLTTLSRALSHKLGQSIQLQR